MRLFLFVVLLGCWLTLPTLAQDATPTTDPDDTTIAPIGYDLPQIDTITDRYFFDWWRVTLLQGSIIGVEMQGRDGLAPLIGILDPEQNLLARSDNERPPEPNGLAVLEFVAPTDGEFTIVATREGNDQGTTSGVYEITVTALQPLESENDRVEVEFRCSEMVITTALQLEFRDETLPPTATPADGVFEFYRLTIYGQEAIQPAIRAEADVSTERLDCTRDAQGMADNTLALPGQTPVTITQDDLTHMAQMSLRNSSPDQRFGEITFTMGSVDGGRGHYVAILDGLALQSINDVDELVLRPGPLAGGSPMTIYMVGAPKSRLDPHLTVLDTEGSELASCDDAGRTGCEGVTPFTGAETIYTLGETITLRADRFDAGVTVTPEAGDILTLHMASRDGATSGAYSIWIIGELPE
jgi:hypothetical protein